MIKFKREMRGGMMYNLVGFYKVDFFVVEIFCVNNLVNGIFYQDCKFLCKNNANSGS